MPRTDVQGLGLSLRLLIFPTEITLDPDIVIG